MKSKYVDWLAILIVCVSLIATLVACDQRNELKAQAVKRGYAEWVVGENGDTTFRWKEAKP